MQKPFNVNHDTKCRFESFCFVFATTTHHIDRQLVGSGPFFRLIVVGEETLKKGGDRTKPGK